MRALRPEITAVPSVSDPIPDSLEILQQRLAYRFRDPGLLECAVTHPSLVARNQSL